MKIRRNIYIIIGITFIVLNLLIEIQEYPKHPDKFNDISYLIGYNFLVYCGLILLGLAYRVQRKINRKKRIALDELIKNIGKPE